MPLIDSHTDQASPLVPPLSLRKLSDCEMKIFEIYESYITLASTLCKGGGKAEKFLFSKSRGSGSGYRSSFLYRARCSSRFHCYPGSAGERPLFAEKTGFVELVPAPEMHKKTVSLSMVAAMPPFDPETVTLCAGAVFPSVYSSLDDKRKSFDLLGRLFE